jgi:tetratricopeptide (TPR) repeat protein
MKAFLSHSSTDKQYVDKVAEILGREAIVYDRQSFDHGEQFRTEIIRGMAKSTLFVFFISRKALASMWVKFELDEAQRRLFSGLMRHAIGVFLEPDISFDDIPTFLKAVNIPRNVSPRACATLIREKIVALRRAALPELFVGRTQDVERIEKALLPLSQAATPRPLLLWGLPGIGRTTLARRIARDVLDFQRAHVVTIESGDRPADLRVKMAILLEVVEGESELKKIQAEADKRSTEENNEEILTQIMQMHRDRAIPIFVDQGGLMDEDGEVRSYFVDMLRVVQESTAKCFLVSRRKPAEVSLSSSVDLPLVRVNPLDVDASRRLLRQLADWQELTLSQIEIDALLTSARGYPPAFYQAVSLMKEYGKELLIRNQQPLVEFRERSFFALLQTENKFTNAEKKILELLPPFDALPLPVISEVTGLDQVEVDQAATKLLNISFLEIDDSGYYYVTDPIRDAVQKLFGRLDINYGKIADSLSSYMADAQVDVSLPLALYRARFKAHVLAGRGTKNLFHMSSDLVRSQQSLYHEQDYERSIEYGKAALDARPHEADVLKYLARAYIQLERHEEFSRTLDEMRGRSPVKEIKFLEGFAYRKRGDTRRASIAYEEAIALGMRGAAVHRELGQCLFEEGRLSEAREHIAKANEADPGNKFVIDIEIKIAIREKRLDDARRSLARLEQVDSRMRTAHRRSTIEAAAGFYEAAYDASAEAMNAASRPQFEILSQFINCAIKTEHLEEAEEALRTLDGRFRNLRGDIQHLLRGRLALARGQLNDADRHCELIKNKTTGAWKGLRLEILKASLGSPQNFARDTDSIKAEVKTLETSSAVNTPLDPLEFELE